MSEYESVQKGSLKFKGASGGLVKKYVSEIITIVLCNDIVYRIDAMNDVEL